MIQVKVGLQITVPLLLIIGMSCTENIGRCFIHKKNKDRYNIYTLTLKCSKTNTPNTYFVIEVTKEQYNSKKKGEFIP